MGNQRRRDRLWWLGLAIAWMISCGSCYPIPPDVPPGAGVSCQGCDLSGQDWRDRSLVAADFRGAIAQRTQFNGSVLSGAQFQGVDGRGAVFDQAQLHGAQFERANLAGASFKEADLSGVDFTGAYLRGAYLRGARLHNARLVGADLKDANLRDVDGAIAQQPVDLSGANLQGADLRQANFHQATLRDADLTHAKLSGASFRQADLIGATLPQLEDDSVQWDYAIGRQSEDDRQVWPDWQLEGTPCVFTLARTPAQQQRLAQRRDRLLKTRLCPYCDLVGVDLHGLDLRQANLKGADLRAANLHHTDLREANLMAVDLSPVPRLSDGDLCRYAVHQPNLRQTQLQGATLVDIQVDPTTLAAATFTEAIADLDLLAQVQRQRQWTQLLTTGHCPHCDLQRLDLTGHPDLLYGANLQGANLRNSIFYRDYTSAERSHPDRVSFYHTDLRQADLSGARISPEESFSQARLCHTILPNGRQSDRDC
jgi:uncharacterized protein YjbI with pentapeptide repeats